MEAGHCPALVRKSDGSFLTVIAQQLIEPDTAVLGFGEFLSLEYIRC